MYKFLNRAILLKASLLISSSLLYAQNTVCYKNNWENPSTIEKVALEGEKCQGIYSLKDMQNKGWKVLDIQIDSSTNGFDYKYLLNKKKNIEEEIKSKLSFNAFGVKIDNIKNNRTTINFGNLIVGQSGVVIHLAQDNKKLIVANAKVISSNKTSSLVEFFPFDDLKQDALPLSKRKATKGDILAMNYLYQSSLLIAPTQELFQGIRKTFKDINFIHSDLFASALKNEGEELPNKETIQKFAIKQNLGTIFIVANKKLNIFDTKTFTQLASYKMRYDEQKAQLPFYTRIEKIEKSPIKTISDFSFKDLFSFDKKEVKSKYEYHYSQFIGK